MVSVGHRSEARVPRTGECRNCGSIFYCSAERCCLGGCDFELESTVIYYTIGAR